MADGATDNGREPNGAVGLAELAADESEQSENDRSIVASESQQHQPLLKQTHDGDTNDEEGADNNNGRRRSRRAKSTSVRIDVAPEDQEDATDGSDDDLDIPQEPLKTLVALVFMFLGNVTTTVSLAIVHDHVPDTRPLPDRILDNVSRQDWGVQTTEVIITVGAVVALLLAIFHKHRFIVLRRIFFLFGIHYYYRALCMFVTVLPKPDVLYECDPKTNGTTAAIILDRAFKVLSGMGLVMAKKHTYCGDYIYSGHTMTAITAFLIIKEYTPRRWFVLHWVSFFVAVTAVATLMVGHGHYTVDVIIAYWITTRLWWMYHTLANNPGLAAAGNKYNYLSNMWWWYIFWYFEANVGRPLPKRYNWPLPKNLTRGRPWTWRSRGAVWRSGGAAAADNRDSKKDASTQSST